MPEAVFTIRVESDEFVRFVNNFNDFTERLKDIDKMFNSIAGSVNQTTQGSRALTSSLQNMLASSKNLHGSIKGITSEFGKWATLIGGTVMMLGGGVGMFGIDRLLNNFMQRQRTALGMGMTTAQTQAAGAMEGLVPGSPTENLRNIQLGLHGDISKRIGLNRLGVDMTKPPEQILEDAMKALPGALKRAPPGFELMYAHQTHLTDIFSDQQILEALKHPEEWERRIRELEEYRKSVPKLGPEETRKLDDLKMSWVRFTGTVETKLTQAVAKIAPFLGGIAGWMTSRLNKEGIGAFIPNPTYQLTKGVESLVDPEGMKSKIIEWGKQLEKFLDSPVEDFKKNMLDLNKSIWDTIQKLNYESRNIFQRMWDWLTGKPGGGSAAPGGAAAPAMPIPGEMTPPGATGPTATPPASTATPVPTAPVTIPGSVAPAVPSTMQPSSSGATFSDRFGGSNTFTDRFNAVNGPTSFSTRFGNNSSSFSSRFNAVVPPNFAPNAPTGQPPSAPSSSSFGDRFGAWKSSMNSSAPRGGSFASLLDRHSQTILGSLGGGGPGGGSKRGGLDTNNWQMSRTATLRVQDVPGSNIFASATGMAG